MNIVMHVAIVLLLATPAVAQAQGHQAKEETTKVEIQKLFSDLNDAITKRDRPRLEQLYADEFQFIRPSGGVINKVTQINGIMSSDPIASTPIPAPAIESLIVYGDVVVSRHTVRGTAVSSIFVKKDGHCNYSRHKARVWRPSANYERVKTKRATSNTILLSSFKMELRPILEKSSTLSSQRLSAGRDLDYSHKEIETLRPTPP